MDQGVTLETMILLAGFASLVVCAVWHRTQLDTLIDALPRQVRDRLGWHPADGSSAKKHRRDVASRLMLRGLPGWLPLPEAGWRHLMWYRLLGLGSALYIAVVPALVAGVWDLLALIGLPLVVIMALRGWQVGPWGGDK